jgi:hypothetical protein
MFKLKSSFIVSAALATGLFVTTTGCEQLPGSPGAQGATIGGVGGAAAGAAIGGENHRLVGALLGGAIGAGGGYLIGANSDRITGRDKAGAEQAVQAAQARPATAEEAGRARTADINADGFVTMDEVVALRAAGLSDQEMLDRLTATGQIFELTAEQERYLREHGVNQYVVDRMRDINRDLRDRLIGQQNGSVVGRPANP